MALLLAGSSAVVFAGQFTADMLVVRTGGDDASKTDKARSQADALSPLSFLIRFVKEQLGMKAIQQADAKSAGYAHLTCPPRS